ncbi:sulfotransferase domain-containing protein [Saccharicrinis aurantiacus]|uniref:sulfotransferase domain-containing protein n=1 Tax=Saccharicrinis aurantiacus TaxID=1849719 RepID=UPI00248FCFAC|nr:sulfotransferase domain-containing protein [Saccharicrinis aurantiacus]
MKTYNNIEYKGYEVLADILIRIARFIEKPAAYLRKKSRKMMFERYKLKFGERDDDIYISTYPKSGTTLMQMIMYQLTTTGDNSFDHIYDVSPWIHNDSYLGKEPRDLPSPRIIKTHDYYKEFHKTTKGRFIFVYRDGRDVAVSFYNQHKNYNNTKLKFEDYMDKSLKSKAWFKYTKTWFKNKHNFPILFVKYEDLINNKRGEIDRIIDFCKFDVDEKTISRAIKYSSFEYMKQNESKFGDQPIETKKIYNQFIRKGKIGEGKLALSKSQLEVYDKLYNKQLAKHYYKLFENSIN